MERLQRHKPWIVAGVTMLLLIGLYDVTIAPPWSFVPGTMVDIARGSTLAQVADDLGTAKIIEHPFLLRVLLRVTGEGAAVKTGLYKFDTPTNLIAVAYRLVTGRYGITPVRLTFIEGETNDEMGAQIAQALPGITAAQFLATASGQQGYLFPDTYFFQPGIEATTVVSTMNANFLMKIASLQDAIAASGHALSDIVDMASIIEKEAKTSADKRIVAGILWSRLKLHMPLQVDAAKVTYTHVGLPPEPICNPGLDSIDAAINPTQTKYLYYLTGNDGLMHYATTYAQHQANLRKYLQ